MFGLGEEALALALACYGIGLLIVTLNIPCLVGKLGVIRTMVTGVTVVGLVITVAVTAVATSTGAGWFVLLGI